MQIVSEALFEKLPDTPLLHTSTHNRIALVTSSQLILREVSLQGRRHHLPLKGNQVVCLSLENPHFIVLLYLNGIVEVRKVDSLSQLVITCQINLPQRGPYRVRVSSEAVYIIGKGCIECVCLVKEKGRSKIFLEEAREQPQDLLISSIFDEEIILVQYPSSIALTAEGKNIAEAPFEGISTFKLLKDPL